MELLLLSSSRTPAGYLTDYLAEIRAFSAGAGKAVFVPFAAVALPPDEYLKRVSDASGHLGFSSDERLAEFARVNPGLPVIGLPEGAWLRVSDSTVELRGPYPAVLFAGEKPPRRLVPGKLPPNFGDSA